MSLSFFGLAHIFYELAYIRKHLLEKLPKHFIVLVISLLTFLVLIKTITLFTLVTYSLLIEVLTLISLLLVTFYYKTSIVNALIVLGFSIAIIYNPIFLLMCLGFLHNLTPWGFLVIQNDAKRAWIVFALNPAIVFILSLIVSFDTRYFTNSDTTGFLSHYLITPGITSLTVAFFSTAVYLQLIHYYYVIRILPEYCSEPIKANRGMLLVFLLIGIGFLYNFQVNKPIYGVIAMFHAYLEIPLLLFLLPAGRRV